MGLQFTGQAPSQKKRVLEVNDADYLIPGGYRDTLVLLTNLSASRRIDLPTVGNKDGDVVVVKDRSALAQNYPIVVAYGLGDIDDSIEYFVSTAYGSLEFIYNNGQWWVREDLRQPDGLYLSSQNQSLTAANTSTDITFNNVQFPHGLLEFNNNKEFKAKVKGTYRFTLKVSITDASRLANTVYLCFQRNTGSGYNGVVRASERVHLPARTINEFESAILIHDIDLEAGWSVKAVFGATSTLVSLVNTPSPFTGISEIPSAKLSIARVSMRI